MTEAEALDMAAKAAGWEDYNIALYNDGDVESIRAHAKTIMELAKLMTTCEEATTRMELMYLQHQKVVDDNAALEAKLAVAREAMTAMHKDLLLRAEIDIRDGTKIVHASNGVWLKFCAALERIDHD